MMSIREAIAVEGKYDANALRQIVDTLVIPLGGFSIFRDRETLSLLRRIALRQGLIVLTDSDGAGFLIRSFLSGALPKDRVKHAYIPDVYGKEKRKAAPSKEGKLGAEGMPKEILLRALHNATAMPKSPEKQGGIGTSDLYALGLSGRENSAQRRARLLKALDLPERLSTAALLGALNALFDREEFFAYYCSIEG